MIKYRTFLACLVLLAVVLTPTLNVFAALPPLAGATFPVGTIVVPMDGKQGDRIRVYGFIHEFLRLTPDSGVARIVEPPDVSMQTTLTPSGSLYQGGPFLIDARFLSAANALLSKAPFTGVTITRLTTAFTSNQVFFVRQPTRILVIRGFFGRSDLYTLDLMGINYTVVDPDTVVANPSIINNYTLIVVDDPGWWGTPNTYSQPAKIQAVYDTIRAHVQAGNEVFYDDIALKDMNATFPGYVNLMPDGGSGSWISQVHNPPIGSSYPAEYLSQYYNPGTNPNTVRLFTDGNGWVVSSVQAAHTSDVRILIDSSQFGVPYKYAILGFYFQYGNGIVEGTSLHSQSNLYPLASDVNGFYAVRELYGNKFVHGPQLDFLMSATPTSQAIHQGLVASYTVTVTSVGSFSSPVALQLSTAPSGLSGSFSPVAVTPPQGGVVSSVLTIPTSLTTPVGKYNLTITGTSTFPLITHSIQAQLNITQAPADFSIDAKPKAPTPLIINPGQCGNITVSVTSIGNFSAPVNLTLTNRPSQTQVTLKFAHNPITPAIRGTVLSNVTFCVISGATPANYTMTVVGTSPAPNSITHTVDVLLRVPKPPPGPAINPLIYLLLLALLLLALGLALLAFALTRRRVTRPRAVAPPPVVVPAPIPAVVARPRPPVRYVLPLPTVRCRFCGRIMPLHSVYCPYCGRPQAMVPSGVVVPVATARVGRRVGMGFILALLSGILVLLNAAVLLVPSFYATWSSIFWWLPTIGPNYAFALGLVIGLVLLMGCIIMVLGQGAFAAVIIFPFAVFSLIIGGGFVAGMILGVVGGILGVMKR